MPKGILITQCLQNDFVEPIGKYDALPNLLHVGYSEAKRLMGENIKEGPVNSVMDWAYQVSENMLDIIHIRDWHNTTNKNQHSHLAQFGNHCIQETAGAQFVFQEHIREDRKHYIINSSGLNDFIETDLMDLLSPYANDEVNLGIMGVWTEAKVLFLAYELKTRFPQFKIGVCSALTASSSRASHFIGLEQMKKILDIQIIPSVGSFTSFLAGSIPEITNKIRSQEESIQFNFEGSYSISDTDRKILYYFFKNCKEVDFKCLDGGFSGNVVLKSKSIDIFGHRQVPCVIKIGERNAIAQERTAFEQIQEVMGNNAPNIVDFAEIGERGAIKYRYASMLDGNVQTFQDIYEKNEDLKTIFYYMDVVFKDELGRLYDVEELEKLNLIQYYDFQAKYSPHVRKNVEKIIGKKADGDFIEILPQVKIPNVCLFYESDLPKINGFYPKMHYMSFIHGDLNGKNIIIDTQNNIWLIDFFHTHRGHVLKDLIKFENDLLYIFTKITDESELLEAFRLSDILLSVQDLGTLLDETIESQFQNPKIKRAFLSVRKLRSFYIPLLPLDRDPYQIHVGFLRYAMHTLSFDECNDVQKKWALYTGSICAQYIKENIHKTQRIRIDFIASIKPGRIGMTILPGRKDRNRSLSDDLNAIKEQGITHVLCLISENEFHDYGVDDLKKEYAKEGFEACFFPILDQSIPEKKMTIPILDWMENAFNEGKSILIHCVGGLGRSGMMAALFLKSKLGFTAYEAIQTVRDTRTLRAIETRKQEQFIEDF